MQKFSSLKAMILIVVSSASIAHGADGKKEILDVWPAGTATYAPAQDMKEGTVDVTDARFGKRDTIVWNVTHPTLEVVRPKGKSNGAAIIVAPGGGFRVLSYANEGTRVAQWLAAKGFTAFVLKYHLHALPNDPAEVKKLAEGIGRPPGGAGPQGGAPPPRMEFGEVEKSGIADGVQAVRLVRNLASTYKIDPARVGIIGFSAGGAVSGNTAITPVAADRPNFVGVIYAGLRDPIPAGAPPAFFAAAADDPLAAGMPDVFARWIKAGAQAELHVYSKGQHGFGTHTQGLPVDGWLDTFYAWIVQQGFVKQGS